MKITTIHYSQSVETMSPMGLKKWEKIGADAEVEGGENVSAVFLQLKNEVESWFESSQNGNSDYISTEEELYYNKMAENTKKFNETLYPKSQPIPTKDISEEKSTADRVIEQINECLDLKVLGSFHLIAKKDERIWMVWNQRMGFLEAREKAMAGAANAQLIK